MSNRIYPVPQPLIGPLGPRKGQAKTPDQGKFARVLEKAQGELKFSRHAQQRMQTRNIQLGAGEVVRLQEAVEKAAGKGARDSLILLDDLAFVVSVKNKTVITALDGESIREQVFTNIDSAVIVK